jgi:7,8-dihydroneopterin aldolase/epimerase/oxygenase
LDKRLNRSALACVPDDHLRPGWRRVIVEGFELAGSVGVYEHERRARQPLVVSLGLIVIDDYDGRSDRLGDVYDYDLAIEAIRLSVENGHINLLETLAERIAEACLADTRVLSVDVRIEKPAVLPACRSVGIEIRRLRTKVD